MMPDLQEVPEFSQDGMSLPISGSPLWPFLCFTKVLVPVVAWLRSRYRGIQLLTYLDNILGRGMSLQEVLQSLSLAVQAVTWAGFILNIKKYDITSSQDLVYVGGRFMTWVCVPSFQKIVVKP